MKWKQFFDFAKLFMTGDRVKQAKMIFSMIDESGDGEVNKPKRNPDPTLIRTLMGGEQAGADQVLC